MKALRARHGDGIANALMISYINREDLLLCKGRQLIFFWLGCGDNDVVALCRQYVAECATDSSDTAKN